MIPSTSRGDRTGATAGRPTILFIAGSDTDVGKTHVAALFAKQLRHSGKCVGVYKPVASGCDLCADEMNSSDATRLWEAAGKPLTLDAVCPQKFLAPLAPNVAALLEGRQVDREKLATGVETWYAHSDVLIVEGAGGLLSPIADGYLNIHLAIDLKPVELVIVVANRLGAIHQTLSTCEAAEARGIRPSGIILCEAIAGGGEALRDNAAQIALYTSIPILAELPFDPSADADSRTEKAIARLGIKT